MNKAYRMKGMIRFGLNYSVHQVSRSIIAYLKINLLTGDLEKRVMETGKSRIILYGLCFISPS